jgi:branched-chain amino acid transport system ATP-binding protein
MGIVKTYQVPRPFPKLTVLENLLVASLSSSNMKKADAVKYDLEILKLVGLDKVKHVPAGSLLPFQLRKLEMARALACKPKLLLLDEPAAGVRGEEVASLMDILNRIFNMVSTIILVEHRMEVVLRVARRVMVMHRGMKLFEGKPDDVLDSKIVIEAYLGEERK